MKSDVSLTYKSFLHREYSFRYRDYNIEFEYYNLIADGMLDEVKKQFSRFGGEGAGVLSDNPVNNIRYHFVITAGMVARFCIERGMDKSVSFALSDYYINLVDNCVDIDSIEQAHYDMVCDYTRRMRNVRKDSVCSKPVVIAMDYIYDHLHDRITVREVADHVGLSASYLSRLFHASTGTTLSEYVLQCRVKAAENMLKYSEYTAEDIANYLSFSSHSHFISIFKKYNGMTPREFRNKYYRCGIAELSAGQHIEPDGGADEPCGEKQTDG